MDAVSTIFLNRGMPSDDMCGRELFHASLVDVSKETHIPTFAMLNYGEDPGALSGREVRPVPRCLVCAAIECSFLKALCAFLNEAHHEIVTKAFLPFSPVNMFLSAGNSHALSVLSNMRSCALFCLMNDERYDIASHKRSRADSSLLGAV